MKFRYKEKPLTSLELMNLISKIRDILYNPYLQTTEERSQISLKFDETMDIYKSNLDEALEFDEHAQKTFHITLEE